MNAFLAFLLVSLAGFALLCAGVWMLAGTGWSLIAGALSLFCIAGFIRRGITNG